MRRSAALALAGLAVLPVSAGAAGARFTGEVTDALRNPAHRLVAGANGRAVADLLFADAQHAHTTAHTCVRRDGTGGVRTCFDVTTEGAGVATVTPLRFRRGSYVVTWRVAGQLAARWRFAVR